MIKPPERVEIPEREEPREWLARFLAVAIVISTLGLALIEFAHGFDAKRADSAGVDAQKLGVQRQGADGRASALAHLQLQMFSQAEEERTRSGNAFQDFLLHAAQNVDTSSAEADYNRWSALAGLTDNLTSIHENSPAGPAQDLQFPSVALNNAQLESEKFFALQDAANEERQAWESRLSQYSVILTLFAVAIYLFGLSLTLQRGVRHVITGLAILLLLGGTVWGSALQLNRPSRAPDAVAEDYAKAYVTLINARTHEQLQQAEAMYSGVIDERPTFAQAYADRSFIRFDLASPEFPTNGFTSITSPDALRASAADLQKAYDLGLRSYVEISNLTGTDVLLGMQDNNQDALHRALQLGQQGLATDNTDPELYSAVGFAKLLLGDVDGAKQAFKDEVDRTLHAGKDHHVRTDPGQYFANLMLSGTMTPLEILKTKRPDLAGVASDIQLQLVKGMFGDGGGRDLKLGSLHADVFPSTVQWTALIPGFDATKDVVVAQWYHNDPAKMGWGAISPVSGDHSASILANGTIQDGYFDNQSFIAGTATCTSTGSYRVDVYVNGHFKGTSQANNPDGGLKPAFLRGVGLNVCRPADWVHDDTGNDYIRGFDEAYTSADKSRGVVVYRVQNPDPAVGSGDKDRAMRYRSVLTADNTVESVLPTGFHADTADTAVQDFARLSPASVDVTYMVNDTGQQMIEGSGVDSDGSVLIGLVFGPTSDFQSGIAQRVFESLLPT